jgi:hypothetical protein
MWLDGVLMEKIHCFAVEYYWMVTDGLEIRCHFD